MISWKTDVLIKKVTEVLMKRKQKNVDVIVAPNFRAFVISKI